jgi:hypothetical protein
VKQGKRLQVRGATAEIGIGLAAVTFVTIALAPRHPVLVAGLVVTVLRSRCGGKGRRE